MIIHKEVFSTTQPPEIEILDTKVFVASNIEEATIEFDAGFKFTLTEYDKNEYIHVLADQNQALLNELLDTQSALCDIYEQILGG